MGFFVPDGDVKFPKTCEECHFYDGLLCCVLDVYLHAPEQRYDECPLIEVPAIGSKVKDLMTGHIFTIQSVKLMNPKSSYKLFITCGNPGTNDYACFYDTWLGKSYELIQET